MNLLVLRHAESEGNASGNYSTAIADSLSSLGKKQALSLVDSLRASTFDKIIVSPRQRAMETIAPYLAATRQRAEIWPEVAEACWHGEREEPSVRWNSQPAALPPPLAPHFFYRNNEAIVPADQESFGAGLRRVLATIDLLQQAAHQGNSLVLMVTHGHFIRELLNLLLELRDRAEFPHENCGMTSVSLNRKWTMEFCNRLVNTVGANKTDPRDGV